MSSLEALVTARLAALGSRQRAALYRAVEAAESTVDLLHRHHGARHAVPHPIALTPFIVPRRALPGLARLAECVHRFQTHAPRLHRDGIADFRALCPVSATTARWLARRVTHEAPWALMIRPDVGLADGAPPGLFETNATALAGLYNHAAGVAILRREVLPRVLTPAERRHLDDPPDLLDLTVRWVVRAARRVGRRRLTGVAFVEDPGVLDGYSEVPRLVHAFRRWGLPAAHGAVEALRRTRRGIVLGDQPVDLVYRDLAFDDLGPPPTNGTWLAAFVELLDRGAVVPDLAGEFAHKGLLEGLTSPAYRTLFTPGERRWLAACVPWTRVLTARVTEEPTGRRVDLPEYVRRHAARLLIKPNVGSSGDGILLGAEVSALRWERRIARALREPGAWVVQARRPAASRPMVYLRKGVGHWGPCHSSLGLFYAPGDLGLHCRVSQAPVVNVARGGALACAFVGT